MAQPAGIQAPGVGEPAPAFSLTAVTSNRPIGPANCHGRWVLLLFHGHNTVAAISPVQEAARGRFPLAEELMVASVVDLRRVPVFVRGVAEVALRSAYSQGAAHVPEHLDPADYVVILPDWKGKITDRFGFRDVNKTPAVALIDAEWRIAALYQGHDVGAAVARLLPPAVAG